jgi:hypothetical protein
MASVAEEQIASLTPPRRGAVWAVSVDSTARAYDLSTSILGAGATVAPEAAGKRRQYVVLYLQADTNDVYFYFDTATGTSLSDTAKQAASAASLAFSDTYCAVLKAGSPPIQIRIDRSIDKFIQVKAVSTAGVLRMWACSEAR